MPPLILPLLLAISGDGQHGARPASQIDLVDGEPIKLKWLRGGIKASFDGKESVLITTPHGTFRISAKTPSLIGVSSDGSRIVHNYGDGSGQVYSIAFYQSRSGNSMDIQKFYGKVMRYSKSIPGCRIRLEEISFLFTRWRSNSVALIRTEDMSRRAGCSKLNRLWDVSI